MIEPIQILLVEDNEADAFLTKETLESQRVHVNVTVLSDGVTACDYLLRRPPYEQARLPDLVLLDLNLPGLDGRGVLREIREHAELRRVPVVILTSSDAESDVIKSYELGANCYVTKPVGLQAFQTIVRSVENFWFTIVKLP